MNCLPENILPSREDWVNQSPQKRPNHKQTMFDAFDVCLFVHLLVSHGGKTGSSLEVGHLIYLWF